MVEQQAGPRLVYLECNPKKVRAWWLLVAILGGITYGFLDCCKKPDVDIIDHVFDLFINHLDSFHALGAMLFGLITLLMVRYALNHTPRPGYYCHACKTYLGDGTGFHAVCTHCQSTRLFHVTLGGMSGGVATD